MKPAFFVVIGLVVLALYIGILMLAWPTAVFDWQALSILEMVGLTVLTVAVLGGYVVAFKTWGHKLPG